MCFNDDNEIPTSEYQSQGGKYRAGIHVPRVFRNKFIAEVNTQHKYKDQCASYGKGYIEINN